MNRIFASLLVAAVAEAASTYSGYRKASETSKYRFGAVTEHTLIETASVVWSVTLQVNVNEDTGQQMLRIHHTLEADILQADTVTFELSFVPESKWDNVDDADYAGGLGEDAGRCEMINNSDDPQFWEATLTDIYYKCSGDPAAATAGNVNEPIQTKCSDPVNTYNSNSVLSESSSNNQWELPFEDDDPDAPWCTLANTATTYSPFWCSQIECTMERPLNTGDTVYDWAFRDYSQDSSSGVYDTMIIMNGRAQLWITSADYDIAMVAPTLVTTETDTVAWNKRYISLEIKAGALMLGAAFGLLYSSTMLF